MFPAWKRLCSQAWLLSITPDAKLIGLMLRWKNLNLERQEKPPPVTKAIKPQLGDRQGRCRWVWGNYRALSDSSVPEAWTRAGDLEIWSRTAADGAGWLHPARRTSSHWQLSAACGPSQLSTAWRAGPICSVMARHTESHPGANTYRL